MILRSEASAFAQGIPSYRTIKGIPEQQRSKEHSMRNELLYLNQLPQHLTHTYL